jgi:predicted Zn-dependent peptidase
MLNNFRRDVITPDRMLICAGGVYSHQEFVDTMSPYFQYLTPKTPVKREAAKYIGGEARELTESDDTWIHLSFQSPSWTSEELGASYILHSIISPPCSGQVANCRANTHFMQKHQFINSAKSVLDCFSDSGNWGMTVSGPNAKSGEMADALIKEVQDLTKVTDQEVSRAKNILKT